MSYFQFEVLPRPVTFDAKLRVCRKALILGVALLLGIPLCSARLQARGLALGEVPLPGHIVANVSIPSVDVDPASACDRAIQQAEARYQLPAGMLHAIGLVESGRTDARTGLTRPWPWAVQADGQNQFFNTRAEAVAWVRDAQSRGVSMIDVGCLQIDLYFHPDAFPSVDLAFEPADNVDYAARFLLRLHVMTGDWTKVIGFYHSRTPEFADPYQRRVQQVMGVTLPDKPVEPPSLLTQVAEAWRFASSGATPTTSAAKGNSWDTLLQPSAITAERSVAAASMPVARDRLRLRTAKIAALGPNY